MATIEGTGLLIGFGGPECEPFRFECLGVIEQRRPNARSAMCGSYEKPANLGVFALKSQVTEHFSISFCNKDARPWPSFWPKRRN